MRIGNRTTALAALFFTVAACNTSATSPATERPRVVVLALDGGTWDLLDPFMSRGLLPNLARLRREGTWGPLASIKPSSSPVIWTTVATGKTPEKHGITFFVRFPDGDTGRPKPVSATMRRAAAIWGILSEAGHDVAVVGWFVTWPAEEVRGRIVSDRAHYRRVEGAIYPPTYLAALERPTTEDAIAAIPSFMKVSADATNARARLDYLVTDRFVKAYSRDLYYLHASRYVLDDGRLPDFFALYLRGTDDVQHGFWKFMDPEPFGDVPEDQVEAFGRVIERYWQWTDAAVGEVLSRYDENTLVLVVSDHGAGPAVGRYKVLASKYRDLSGSHRDDGILIAHGPGVRGGATVDGASVHDVTPTLLHYLGLPVGEDMDGRVLTDLFEPAIASRPVATVPTYDEPRGAEPAPRDSEVDPQILEHLRSLGYID